MKSNLAICKYLFATNLALNLAIDTSAFLEIWKIYLQLTCFLYNGRGSNNQVSVSPWAACFQARLFIICSDHVWIEIHTQEKILIASIPLNNYKEPSQKSFPLSNQKIQSLTSYSSGFSHLSLVPSINIADQLLFLSSIASSARRIIFGSRGPFKQN